MEHFVELFTDFYTLRRLIARSCNNFLPYSKDPITDVACSMISSPLEVCVSSVGVCMFHDFPNIVLPFSHMTIEQKCYLNDLLFEKSDLSTTEAKGNCVRVRFASGTKVFHVDVRNVLLGVCSSIHAAESLSGVSLEKKRVLANFILQRIGSCVHIQRQVFVSVYEWMKLYFSENIESNISGESCTAVKDECLEHSTCGFQQEDSGGVLSVKRGKRKAMGNLVVED
jgi:hypothetical protein